MPYVPPQPSTLTTPLLGSSYVARSVNAACARMVNLFPEIVPEGGMEPAFLNRAPGLRLLQTVGTGPIRGLWAAQGVLYVVSGGQVFKLDAVDAAPVLLGPVSGSGPVSIADNGIQLFFACSPEGFIYNTQTGVFSQITDPDFAGAVTVGYSDGYFIFNEPNSQKVWATQLLDGTSVEPLDFASAEGAPDQLIALLADHREIWMFGADSTEVWYDAGIQDFPFLRVSGAFNEIGCIAAHSVAKLDNGVFWLGGDARGQGIVYRADGYTGRRISTHAVEWQIQQYETLSDAVAYTYQQDGHAFYVLNFPTADTTWVYDASTDAWHERAGWNDGVFARHRGNCQARLGSVIVVGDYETGDLYALDLNTYEDNGQPQKWLRSWRALPAGSNGLRRSTHHALQLACESGTGGDTEPQVMLRWSDDGGHTWSREHWRNMGEIGRYETRVIWRRLGMTDKLRDRVYEVSGTDPSSWYCWGRRSPRRRPVLDARIVPPRVALTDARTGLISREWFLFFQSLFNNASDTNTDVSDLALLPLADTYVFTAQQDAALGLYPAPLGLAAQDDLSPVPAPAQPPAYGFFQQSARQTQTTINTPKAIPFDVVGASQGVGLSTTRVSGAGTFELVFTAQMTKTTALSGTGTIWLRVNGSDVALSAKRALISGLGVDTTVSRVWLQTLADGDYVEVMWSADSLDVILEAYAATGFAPAVASATLAILKVS